VHMVQSLQKLKHKFLNKSLAERLLSFFHHLI
jgi:hypothetical protein